MWIDLSVAMATAGGEKTRSIHLVFISEASESLGTPFSSKRAAARVCVDRLRKVHRAVR